MPTWRCGGGRETEDETINPFSLEASPVPVVWVAVAAHQYLVRRKQRYPLPVCLCAQSGFYPHHWCCHGEATIVGLVRRGGKACSGQWIEPLLPLHPKRKVVVYPIMLLPHHEEKNEPEVNQEEQGVNRKSPQISVCFRPITKAT